MRGAAASKARAEWPFVRIAVGKGMGWLRGAVEVDEEQMMRTQGLCSRAAKTVSMSSRGICCGDGTTRQRMIACPRCMNVRCVDVSPSLESVSITLQDLSF